MEIQNISGTGSVSSNFTVENPVHENTEVKKSDEPVKHSESSPDDSRGQVIDTYA